MGSLLVLNRHLVRRDRKLVYIPSGTDPADCGCCGVVCFGCSTADNYHVEFSYSVSGTGDCTGLSLPCTGSISVDVARVTPFACVWNTITAPGSVCGISDQFSINLSNASGWLLGIAVLAFGTTAGVGYQSPSADCPPGSYGDMDVLATSGDCLITIEITGVSVA